MEHLLTYLLKSSLVIGLFYCCYQMFLRNETFFKAKRWFLVSSIVIALIFPFLIIKEFIEAPILQIGSKIAPTSNIEAVTITSNPTNWLFILSAIYVAGCMFFLVRFIIQLFSLYRLIKKGKHNKANSFTMVEIEEDVSPFSFFNFIVFNPTKHSPEDLQTILVHEKVHSTQKHSIDMILAHLLCIFQWINPFAWGYKKAITENLEYLADATTTESLSNKKEYQYLLLGENIAPNTSMPITNTFINSLIKKRIVMLNKKKSHNINLLKMGIVLPLLTIAMLMVNTKTVAQGLSLEGDKGSVYAYIINSNTSDDQLKNIVAQCKEKEIETKFKNVKRNSKGEIIGISVLFSALDNNSGNYNVSGNKPIKQFTFYANSRNKNINYDKIGFRSRESSNNPRSKAIYYVDGKRVNKSDLETVFKNVDTVRALSAKDAQKKYGTNGKVKVMEITTKK